MEKVAATPAFSLGLTSSVVSQQGSLQNLEEGEGGEFLFQGKLWKNVTSESTKTLLITTVGVFASSQSYSLVLPSQHLHFC